LEDLSFDGRIILKMYLNETGSDKTGLFEFMRALVRMVLNLQVPQRTEQILNFQKELCSVEELVRP
jgi:hypothetical protein